MSKVLVPSTKSNTQESQKKNNKMEIHCDLQLKPKSIERQFFSMLRNPFEKQNTKYVCECYAGNELKRPFIHWAITLTMKLMRSFYDKSKTLGPWNIKTKIEEITDKDSFCLVLRNVKTSNLNENNNNNNGNQDSKFEENNDNPDSVTLGDFVGYCSFRIEYEPNWECNELYIYEIMIDQQYANQGLGTYLMNLCEFIGTHKKCKQLGLTCFSMSPAIKFYTKLDYTPDTCTETLEGIDVSDYRLLMKLIEK